MNIDFSFHLFHPLLIHFPIVLFTLAAFFDVVNWWKGRVVFPGVGWYVLLGTLFVLAALYSGEAAAEHLFHHEDPYLESHENYAYTVLALGIFHVAVRFFILRPSFRKILVCYAVMSVITWVLVGITADYGGLLSRGKTPFATRTSSHETLTTGTHSEEPLPSLGLMEERLEVSFGEDAIAPIFRAAGCARCHEGMFHPSGEIAGMGSEGWVGKEKEESSLWLERDKEGHFINIENAPFYRTVIVDNAMPPGQGLSREDRLALLLWIKSQQGE